MPTGYSRSPNLVKGALVELSDPFAVPIPRVIVFQYNPETLTRQLSPWNPPATGESPESASSQAPSDGYAAGHPPQESFTLTLELDATDDLEHPEEHPEAVARGVRDRLSALEMLTYPVDEESGSRDLLIGALSAAAEALGVAVKSAVPVVLFVWGPGLVLPVRIESFSVEEQAYSTTLFPVRAKVSIGLRVLTPSEIEKRLEGGHNAAKKLAVAAYKYTMKRRRTEANQLVASAADLAAGLLPF